MIVGLCRFSYLARERALGWNSVPREPEAARAIVFDEARLAARFRLFERYTLPSLKAQTDGDFRLIVLTSAELPARHRERLADLVGADRRIRLVAAPARDGPRLLRRLFAEAFGDAPRRVSFRIDDDDGLSVRFVERLRAALARTQGAGPLFVSFSKGIVVKYRDGVPDGAPSGRRSGRRSAPTRSCRRASPSRSMPGARATPRAASTTSCTRPATGTSTRWCSPARRPTSAACTASTPATPGRTGCAATRA